LYEDQGPPGSMRAGGRRKRRREKEGKTPSRVQMGLIYEEMGEFFSRPT